MADDRSLPTRIWTVEEYYRVKDFYEARGLVFNPALERGSPAAHHIVAQAQLQQFRGAPSDGGLVRRLLAGPDDAELTPRELTWLEAYLKQPENGSSQTDLQAQSNGQPLPERAKQLAKLRLIRDFNVGLADEKREAKMASLVESLGVREFIPDTDGKQRSDAAHGETRPAAGDGADAPSGFLGGTELADALGIHLSQRAAFFKRLERGRQQLGDDGWLEPTSRRPNAPQYLYRADNPKILKLAAAYKQPRSA